MKTNIKPKLIVLRGNSGCGKSTIAKLLQNKYPKKKIALVGQDYFRRTILREPGNKIGTHTEFIENSVKFLLNSEYHVILEGIFAKKLYLKMLKKLAAHTENSFFFYFYTSLHETIKRSRNKPNFQDWGEEKLKSWWQGKDFLKFKNEYPIPENLSEKETLDYILKTTKL